MTILDLKNERKILDSGVVLVATVSAYLTGYFQVLELGAVTVTLMLPNIFLIGLAFLHLVIRKGRKFDRRAHRLSYEGLKTLIFGAMTYTAYLSGLSTTKNNFFPNDLVTAVISILFVAAGLYLMAYRPNE